MEVGELDQSRCPRLQSLQVPRKRRPETKPDPRRGFADAAVLNRVVLSFFQ